MSIYDNLNSEKLDVLLPALRRARAEFMPAVKNKEGFGYKYADLAQCKHSIEQALDNQELSLFQRETRDDKDRLVILTKLHHDPSGQWIQSIFPVEIVTTMKQCNAMQQLGAGVSYAKRYALCGIVGLATEDNDAASVERTKRKEKMK
jgi:ERF superfamily